MPRAARAPAQDRVRLHSFFPKERGYEEARFYARRAAGGDRHHRRARRAAVAGGASRPRSRPAHAVQQPSEADRPGPAKLSRHVPKPALRGAGRATSTSPAPRPAAKAGGQAGTSAILPFAEQKPLSDLHGAGHVVNSAGLGLADTTFLAPRLLRSMPTIKRSPGCSAPPARCRKPKSCKGGKTPTCVVPSYVGISGATNHFVQPADDRDCRFWRRD